MIKVLVNDGIDAGGKKLLEAAGYQVDDAKIAQEDLPARLNEYDAICVRSATKVRQDLIDATPNLKAIARGGVGLDNIDVDHAKGKGIAVINTPAASSQAVAELAFAHFLSISRFVYDSNRNMPSKGNTEFGKLKKSYAKGLELKGRTLGVLGFGRIGQHAAAIALGMGMKVLAVDPFSKGADVAVKNEFYPALDATVHVETVSLDEMLANADFITLHVPFTGAPVFGKAEFDKMKDGVVIANASRGGTIDEVALIEALDSGKVFGAGLDVFDSEPTPRQEILSHPRVSLTPHIGAATTQAQANIGAELAEKLIAVLG